ncbi:hypothetical protein SS1G_05918 [Sclerotinia sclerotiorum 1980 UF-70]|uniref:Acetylserotonin methytransferase-like protein n=2 Tax=Sclerotinia sclerotiorum (strain ATCC 18683 / 1980 / Ss-1) TaxID=665079 RepID=A7EKS1_SCLS1|nr:hypothetical protein SS1G_05918 [Sclerotinia sclerotiorum 1980 UF-70]APA09853.1 hypothetical protein sscle_05g046230 [Sclerotinia sclerotiorum 1980 UF-70]EDO03437.1 hypothetical protein SS1G_05918 [Sclerotinia sclerotiorum 1980 UF-70]
MPDKPVSMGLQLFPPPPSKKKTWKSNSDERNLPTSTSDRGPANRSQSLDMFVDGMQLPFGGSQIPQDGRALPMNIPPPAVLASERPRSHTSFSEAPTLVRSNSNSSRYSQHHHREEPVMRSIFPRYNPELPLEYQQYYPTQQSPRHIPQNAISRQSYSPGINEVSPGMGSPMSFGPQSPGQFGRGLQDETWPEPSTSAELKELWKVTNGWKASGSEGRKFIMKMNSAVKEPIHTLSSATQPFYTLRLDPTSTSAQVTMKRQNPAKSPRKSQSPKSGVFPRADSQMEVLITTLEEYSRRLPPNDGLVALLYPHAASSMAVDLAGRSNMADGALVLAAAERECGRLLWDDDTKKFYLRHPAVSTPFLIAINSSPAWSRVEYTLEHPELPHNLVRLVRDGSGTGFLEIDTGVAARIDAFYIVDVAIAAVMLAAMDEEKRMHIERFDAPPGAPIQPDTPKSKRKSFLRGEQMELDIESQESPQYKMVPTKEKAKDKEKVPGFCGLLWMMVKAMAWIVKMAVKAIAAILIGLSKCLTRKK